MRTKILKLKIIAYSLLLVMIIAGCKKESLSDEQITKNLAGDWEFNPEHLFGMWKPVRFAYTKDGKKISEVEESLNSDYTVEILQVFQWSGGLVSALKDQLQFEFLENYSFNYSTPSYFARLSSKRYVYENRYCEECRPFGIHYNKFTDITDFVAEQSKPGNIYNLNTGMTWAEYLADFEFNEPTGDEFKIYTVLEKAYGFVIRNDELFIYFTGIEKINLLILKKN
jgi:hypothetical protein